MQIIPIFRDYNQPSYGLTPAVEDALRAAMAKETRRKQFDGKQPNWLSMGQAADIRQRSREEVEKLRLRILEALRTLDRPAKVVEISAILQETPEVVNRYLNRLCVQNRVQRMTGNNCRLWVAKDTKK